MSEVNEEYGALVVYVGEKYQGREVTAVDSNDKYNDKKKMHANAVGRLVDGQMIYAAIFPRIVSGKYFVKAGSGYSGEATVNVFSGHEAEVDFRNKIL